MASSPQAIKQKEDKLGKFDKWTVEDALRDFERAELHKQDPELMAEITKLAGKKVKAISSIAEMKAVRQQLDDDDSE